MANNILSFPFNARLVDGAYDRTWDALDFAAYYGLFIGDGVFPNPATNLKVVSKYNSFALTVSKGCGFIKGHCYIQRKDVDIVIAPPDVISGRRDMIVLELNHLERVVKLVYVEGSLDLTRNDDMYQLKLAEITVNASAPGITQANILDTRPNGEECGIVSGLITQVDTTELFEQYETALNEFMVYQAGRIAEFDLEFEIFRTVMNSLVTQSFTLINNDFDDWSVKLGCERNTVFKADGGVEEIITFLSSGNKLAERITEFPGSNTVQETVKFTPRIVDAGGNIVVTTALEMTKTTVFNEDGSITERADGRYHGPTLDFENNSPITIELNIPKILDGGIF